MRKMQAVEQGLYRQELSYGQHPSSASRGRGPPGQIYSQQRPPSEMIPSGAQSIQTDLTSTAGYTLSGNQNLLLMQQQQQHRNELPTGKL